MAEDMTMGRAHHPMGMSRWPAKLACCQFEGKEGGAHAEFGSEKHEQLAELLTHLKEEGFLPPKADDPDGFFDAGVRRAAELIRDCMVANNVHPATIQIESRVETEDGIFGTADVWYESIVRRTLWVWDFKTFRNPGRDYTAQLAGYALAIRQRRELECLKHKRGGEYLPETFVLRTIYGDSSHVDEVTYNITDLNDTYEDVLRAFKARGEARQCNWCDLCAKAATCPAFRAIAEAVVATPAQECACTEPGGPTPRQAVERWADLPMEAKAQYLVLAETVCKWAEAVREKAKAELLAGGTIQDEAHGIAYSLRQVSGRKVPRTADACRMLQANGVTADAIRGELTISAASIKALLKSAGIKAKVADGLLVEVCDQKAGTVQMMRM